jgi:hypothetical protein
MKSKRNFDLSGMKQVGYRGYYIMKFTSFTLWNFAFIEITKHDLKLHSTGHKFTLMEILDYILIFLNIKCETTTNLRGTILLRHGYAL